MSNTVQFRTEFDIEIAFEERLAEAVSGLDVDVAWPSITYEPEQGQSYVRPVFIPASNSAAAVGKEAPNRVRGFYQIDIVTPRGMGVNKGKGKAKSIIDTIYPHFRRGEVLKLGDDLRIRVEAFQITPLSEDDSGWHTSVVRVVYRSDIKN